MDQKASVIPFINNKSLPPFSLLIVRACNASFAVDVETFNTLDDTFVGTLDAMTPIPKFGTITNVEENMFFFVFVSEMTSKVTE
jgi:hypothetical protein